LFRAIATEENHVSAPQSGILQAVPTHGRYLTFALRAAGDAAGAVRALAPQVDGAAVVAGFGEPTVSALGKSIPGLRPFPRIAAHGVDVPSTLGAVWVWLRGDDPGALFHRSRAVEAALAPGFDLLQAVDAFRFNGGRDLTGYEDGTENPKDEAAGAAAIVGEGPLAGSSFVAVQQWRHSFSAFERMSRSEQDASVGRERDSNAELSDAPPSAHVKRTAQESFTPEAFVLRRSMPWNAGMESGLMFVAFGHSLDAFEAQLRRMSGLEDGVTDALFRFTQPVTGAYYWCPALRHGQLDLAPLGLN
jgi:porphyrinogen peroxidase